MHRLAVITSIAVLLLLADSAEIQAQDLFAHSDGIRFRIRTDRKTYNIGDLVVIHYSVKNIGNGAIYVPTSQWEIKCGNAPHLWSSLKDKSGKQYVPGYGGSCMGPDPVDKMSAAQRMKKDAVLLRPGQTVTGSFDYESAVFENKLKPGDFRLEAILYGWNFKFEDSQIPELVAMGSPFLIGESTASLPIKLRGSLK